MSVRAINEFKRHGRGTANRVEVAASGTEAAFTTKWNKFNFTAMLTTIKGEAIIRIAAIEHFMYIINNGIPNSDTGRENSIKMVGKNLL